MTIKFGCCSFWIGEGGGLCFSSYFSLLYMRVVLSLCFFIIEVVFFLFVVFERFKDFVVDGSFNFISCFVVSN